MPLNVNIVRNNLLTKHVTAASHAGNIETTLLYKNNNRDYIKLHYTSNAGTNKFYYIHISMQYVTCLRQIATKAPIIPYTERPTLD